MAKAGTDVVWKRLVVLSIVLMLSMLARAEVVDDLYSATVPVADHSQAQRDLALRQGLADVLVKLSGTRQVLNQPAVESALSGPASYMVEFGYTSLPVAESELAVSLRYSAPALEQLLRRNQLPVWPANRPLALVWLVMDVPNEGPRVLDRDQDPEATVALQQALARRGLPGRLPLLDLQDQLTVSPEQAWSLDRDSLDASAQRYQADYWLVIRCYRSFDGSWRGSWALADATNPTAGSRLDNVNADSLNQLINNSLDAAVDQLSPAFAYVAKANSRQIALSVDQVNSYADYRALIDALAGLEMVLQVHVDQVAGSQLRLRLETEGDSQLLTEALLRDRRFSQAPNAATNPQGGLHMAWNPQ